MDETFLTVAEIAQQLKLNPQTIRKWIDRGELPAVRVGARRVRVRQSDWDAFLAAGNGRRAKMTRYRVGIGDRATSLPATSEGEAARFSFYDVEASSADRAVAVGIREWHDQAGNDAVARSITVNII